MAEPNHENHWFIYGHDQPKAQLKKILESGPPSWRNFSDTSRRTAYEFQIGPKEREVINASIYLRRPLLVTGDPGTGKSSLAYSIAKELELGKVLVWPITSRSTLNEALYRYDVIGRLQEANLGNPTGSKGGVPPIEKYLTLGPLGTAFADSQKLPRVLLIDEIDKCDIDLPNDLLYLFEEGEFEILELSRLADTMSEPFHIRNYQAEDQKDGVSIEKGQVRCHHFPIVIMTSNGERELPAPFLRRCLRLDMKRPNYEKLEKIVGGHFKHPVPFLKRFIRHMMDKRAKNELVASDQLMNAIYFAREIVLSNKARDSGSDLSKEEEEMVIEIVMKSINRIHR